jgi:hypothetical protein
MYPKLWLGFGQAMLGTRAPVVPRLKAAMTRLGVEPPAGL